MTKLNIRFRVGHPLYRLGKRMMGIKITTGIIRTPKGDIKL